MCMTHTKATFGIFRSRDEINTAVSLLKGLGFGESKASILFPDKIGDQDFPQVQKSELVKFARVGSVIGAVLASIFAVLMIAGVVPFGNLSNATSMGRVFTIVGSLLFGGILGAAWGTLVGIGTPDRAGRRYGQYVNAGGILLSVRSQNTEEQKRIEDALEKSGGQDITTVEEKAGWKDVLKEKENLQHEEMASGSILKSRPLSTIAQLAEEKQIYV